MVENTHPPHDTNSLMPDYRAVLAVDAEKYSRASSYHQRLLNRTLLDALAEAFDRSDLSEQWRTAAFPQPSGDGYVVGLTPPYLPLLIHPLLDELQGVLAEVQPRLAAEDRALRLRLRAALGIGPLPDSAGADRGDGIGTPMNETHRVLDSPVLRQALDHSDPDTTFLAAGLTGRAYDDAVLGGYVALSPSLFHPVTAELPDKGFRAEAFVYVPRPSTRQAQSTPGDGQPQREHGDNVPEPDTAGAAPATSTTTNTTGDVSGRVAQDAHAAGDINFGDHHNIGTQNNLSGTTGDVGTIFTGTATNVNTGSGQQVNNPDSRAGNAPPEEEDASTRYGRHRK